MATAWKCAKTSSRTLVTKELVVASRQYTSWHLILQQGIVDQKQHDCRRSLTQLAWFLRLNMPPFWHSFGDLGRIAWGAEQPYIIRLPGCIQKLTEGLGIVHTRGREVLRRWWWLIGWKFFLDLSATPVPKSINKLVLMPMRKTLGL
jgi:hypothetical protein